MENIEINTNISMDLHPDMMLLHEEALLGPEIRDDKGNPTGRRSLEGSVGVNAYRDAREALEAIYTWHVLVEKAEKEFIETVSNRGTKFYGRDNAGLLANVARQSVINLAQNEQELIDSAETGKSRALAVSARAAETVQRAAESLSKELDKVTEDPDRTRPTGIALATEIRAHVKSLPTTLPKGAPEDAVTRYGFLMNAIRKRDVTSVAAVLRAPAYLSGLTQHQIGELRVAAMKTWAEWQFNQFHALEKVRARLETAHASLDERLTKLKKTISTPIEARNRRKDAFAKLANGGR